MAKPIEMRAGNMDAENITNISCKKAILWMAFLTNRKLILLLRLYRRFALQFLPHLVIAINADDQYWQGQQN
jgi:hypothetical protein